MNRTDVDLHVHTVSSKCGFTTHTQVLEMARGAGRGVVAVTDHDSPAGAVAVRDLAARRGDDILVVVGMELSTSDFGHVIVFGRGVEEDWGWQPQRPFPRHIPEHWAAIQAHPYRGHVIERDGVVEVEALPPLPDRIDAVEIWNGGDLIKRVSHLRREMDAISRAYAAREGKVMVASSDSHRPFWLHSFFTRCARPVESVDDLVDQIRGGEVSPGAADDGLIAGCIADWHRRQVVEWYEAGLDWLALAVAAGYRPEAAGAAVATYRQVQGLHARDASPAAIGEAVGLSPAAVADYLAIVDEEAHTAARRRRPVRVMA